MITQFFLRPKVGHLNPQDKNKIWLKFGIQNDETNLSNIFISNLLNIHRDQLSSPR